MQFTKRACLLARAKLLFTFLIVLVLLQGCSIVDEPTKQQPENLDSIGKDIVDMVDIPANEKQPISDVSAIGSNHNKQNLYLENIPQHIANIPVQTLEKYKQALVLMKKKQWSGAEILFDEILVVQPQLSGVYVNKALISVHQENLKRANKHVNTALTINPINPYAHQLKGRVSRLNGQFVQAEKSYLEALRIWPEYPEAQLNLAILLELYRGRLLDAQKYYTAYLQLQPKDEQVMRWLAGVNIKIKRAGLSIPEPTKSNSPTNTKHDSSGAG
jgi:tetratricopeptide (TPR) repeat protein